MRMQRNLQCMKIFRTSKLFEQFQFTTLIRVCASENKNFYDTIL